MEVSHEKLVAAQNAKREEFHNRLKSEVKLLTCDRKSSLEMAAYTENMGAEDLRSLVIVLNAQMWMLIQAVNNAK